MPAPYLWFSAGKHIGMMAELNVSGCCSRIKAMSLSRSRPSELLYPGWMWTEAASTGDFSRVLRLV